jgi:hypothetical protein
MNMRDSGVAVWSFPRQTFVTFIPCPGEKRVRIDAHDSLENYAVFAVEYCAHTINVIGDPTKPLTDWQICYS